MNFRNTLSMKQSLKLFSLFLVISMATPITAVAQEEKPQSENQIINARIENAKTVKLSPESGAKAKLPFDFFFDFNNASFPQGVFYTISGDFTYQFRGDDNSVTTVPVQDVEPTIVSNSDSFEGTPSVLSGNISSINDAAAVIWGVHFPDAVGSGGGTADFKLRVSSEASFDFFHLCVYNNISGLITCPDEYQRSGEIDWFDFPQVNLAEGDSSLYFAYTKDGSVNAGLDAFLIDNISVVDNTSEPQPTNELYVNDLQPRAAISNQQIEIWGNGFDDGSTPSVYFAGPGADGAVVNLYTNNRIIAEVPGGIGPTEVYVETSGANVVSPFKIQLLTEESIGFASARNISVIANGIYGFEIADMDRDGDLDIVTANRADNEIIVYRMDGSGVVQFTSTIFAGSGVVDVTLLDADNDGDLDIAASSLDDDQLIIYLNTGSGFASGTVIDSNIDDFVFYLTAADLNKDGFTDIIGSDISTGTISIWENQTDGTFIRSNLNSQTTSAYEIVAQDMDRDGDIDIVFAAENDVRYIRNNGDQTYAAPVSIGSGGFRSVFAGDVDGDGDIDILASTAVGVNSEIFLFLNENNSGSFTQQLIDGNGASYSSVYGADFDGDGDLDILAADVDNSDVLWFENLGSGSFSSANSLGSAQVTPWEVRVADLNADGTLDVISADFIDNTIVWYENVEATVDQEISVTTIFPQAGAPGSSVDIFGSGLDEANLTVTFDGVSATINDVNETRISVVVPDIGEGPRFLEVSNDNGTDAYNEDFTVLSTRPVQYLGAQTLNSSLVDGASSVVAFDVDEDDDRDIVIGSITTGNLTLLRNNGDNTYASPEIITTEVTQALELAYGDINNDGFTDIAAVSANTNNVVWLPNDQNGGFGPPEIVTSTAGSARSVQLADFNGDGNLDIAFTGYNNDRIAWVEGEGDGNFGSQFLITQSIDQPYQIFAADIDKDGDIDLASTGLEVTSFKVNWHENDGTGNFTLNNLSSIQSQAFDVTIADIDQNGFPDVISVDRGNGIVDAYLNNGPQSGFSSVVVAENIPGATYIIADDLDGDGDIDLSISQPVEDRITWLENTGVFPFPSFTVDNVNGPLNIITSDVDEDGDLDIINVSSITDQVFFFENEEFIRYGITDVEMRVAAPGSRLTIYGTGFSSYGTLTVTIGGVQASIENLLDNKVVVTVPDVDPGFQTLRVNNDAGERTLDKKFTVAKTEEARFGFNQGNILQSSLNSPRGNQLSDLDGDGDLDVVINVTNTDNVSWLRNEGNNNFQQVGNLVTGSLSNGPTGIDEGDYDLDGDIDLVISNVSGSNIVILKNNGNDTFTAEVAESGISTPEDVLFADLNSDGYLDIVYPSRAGNYIAWNPNDRQGGFGDLFYVSDSFNGPFRVRSGDLDNDGDLDIFATTGSTGVIAWFENLDEGLFSTANNISASTNNPLGADLADIDGDGDLDVIVGFQSSGTINWYSNNGSGSFGAPQALSNGVTGVFDVRAADLDGDGDTDIVSSSSSASGIYIHENLGSGVFNTEELITATEAGAADLSLGDMDNDGDFDILLTSNSAGRIVWFENLDPVAPGNLTATENNLGIILEWDAPADILVGGYNVYRSTSPIDNLNSADRLTPVPIPDLFLSDQSVSPNEEYYYVVTAVEDGSGIETAPSNEAFSRFKYKSLQSLLSPTASGGEIVKIAASNLTNASSTSAVLENASGSFNATVSQVQERSLSLIAPFVDPGTYRIRVNNDGMELLLPEFLTIVQDDRGFYNSVEELNSYTGHAETARLGDLDADGDLDLVVLYTGDDNSIGWFEYLGTDNGFGDYNLITSDFFGEPANGLNREDIRIVDVDLDGSRDIVFTDNGDFSIYWLRNLGNGQFSDPQIVQGQDLGNVNNIEMIDIDNDADFDIVFSVTGPGTSTLYYQLNTGLGDFTNATVIEANNTTIGDVGEIISADLDNNGFPDIIYAGGGGIPAFYLNTGSGFGLRNEFIAGGTTGRFVDAGDFNNDLVSDLVILASDSQSNGFAYIYSNDGSSNLTNTLISPFIAAPDRVVAADISGDGLDDLVVDAGADGVLYTIISDGSGGSVNDISNFTFISDVDSRYFELGDVDGDGDLDIVSVNENPNYADITLHKNTDPPPAQPTNVSATQRIGRIELNWDDNVEADLAGYRILRRLAGDSVSFFITNDLITDSFFLDEDVENGRAYEYFIGAFDFSGNASYISVDSVVAIQPSITEFVPSATAAGLDVRIRGFGFSSVLVNINGENAPVNFTDSAYVNITLPSSLSAGPAEVILTSENYAHTAKIPFTVLRGTDGLFSGGVDYTSDTFFGTLTAADVDNDGDLDLLETFPDANRVDYRLNDGSGQFGDLLTLSSSVGSVQRIKPINIRGGNYPDFVSLPRSNNAFTVFLNNGLQNDVDNTYDIIPFTASNSLPTDIEVADMNRDGRQDVIISSTLDSKINYYPNLSHSDTVLFGPQVVISANAGGPIDIEITDVNSDGLMDVVSAEVANNNVSVYTQQGDGSFTKSTASVVSGITDIEIMDENLDGFQDIITSSSGLNPRRVQVNRNNGSGSFTDEAVLFAFPENIRKIDVGDMNGDGNLDVLASGPTTVKVFLNQGSGTFGESGGFENSSKSISDNILFDSDNDGDFDFAYRSATDGITTLHRNIVQTPLTIASVTTPNANRIAPVRGYGGRDRVSITFNEDISSLSSAVKFDIFNGAISLTGNNFNSIESGRGTQGDSRIFFTPEQTLVYPLDSFTFTLSSETVFENSGGEYFIDSNQNGVYDGVNDNYQDPVTYEVALLGDYDLSGAVWVSDLIAFSDAWINNDLSAYELAPFRVKSGSTFPDYRVDIVDANGFDIEDLITFIRYWNLSVQLNKGSVYNQAKMTTANAKIQSGSEAIRIEKKSSEKVYTADGGITEITYGIKLSSSQSLKGLGLQIEYNPNQVRIQSVSDSEVFNVYEESNSVMLSHIDSTAGLLYIQAANFGKRAPAYNREIAEIKIRSLDGSNTELDIISELIPVDGDAELTHASASLDVSSELPQQFELSQNFPNPFNPTTSIQYQLPENAKVSLAVFDVLGRRVQQLVDGDQIAGYYNLNFDARNLASGVYFYIIRAESVSGNQFTQTRKMTLIK